MRSVRYLTAMLGLCAPAAHAEQLCAARSFVTLSVAAPSLDAELARDIERHLSAELVARRLAICGGAGALAALRVRIERRAGEQVIAHLDVADAVTRKRLERSLELTDVPADARAMAVASATDELLRASWAELQVVDAPAVRAAPQARTQRPSTTARPSFELGALGVFSMLPERAALGGDLFGSLWLGSHAFTLLRVGAAYGFVRHSQHGSARADDLHAALAAGLSLVPRDAPFGLAAEVSAAALRIHFVATPAANAFASSESAWGALAALGVRSWARAGPLRFTLGAAALQVLAPIRATDDGRTAVALDGLGAELSAGIALSIPGPPQ
ncbi:MAG TPA: hypothetical protein VK524_06860 [Polyangiaceae bacterium]|nr:hypothetical protein [Polyangiaceae bacterium]